MVLGAGMLTAGITKGCKGGRQHKGAAQGVGEGPGTLQVGKWSAMGKMQDEGEVKV